MAVHLKAEMQSREHGREARGKKIFGLAVS